MALVLSEKQSLCVDMAMKGHNFTIIGKAGTGKSFIAKEIMRSFIAAGKTFQIVCSTGVSCEVYKREEWPINNAKVLNSFFGIGLADAPFANIVRDAVGKCDRYLLNVQCIIWDEFSMNSSRDLDLIHNICSLVRKCHLPFGGIQFILIGDWLQLPPVVDNFYLTSENAKMYNSPLYGHIIKHQIELDTIFRQGGDDSAFIKLLDDLRQGRCTDESLQFIDRKLSNPISTGISGRPTELCFTRLDENFRNVTILREMEGSAVSFASEDQGKLSKAQEIIPKKLITKHGAPMICLANINNQLHNGTRCTFLSKIDNNRAEIEVEGGGRYIVERWSWTNVNKDGIVVGCRRQIPLKLNFASTIHKAQGSEFSKIIVHSDFEFNGGMMYVALSRAKSHTGVQLVGFRKDHLKSREKEIAELSSLHHQPFQNDISCCKTIVPTDQNERTGEHVSCDSIAPYDDVQNEFERDNVSLVEEEKVVHLEMFLECLEEAQDEINQPPSDFQYETFLRQMKDTSILSDSEHSIRKNEVIQKAIDGGLKTELFIKIIWRKIFLIIKTYIKGNLTDTTFSMGILKNVTSKVWLFSRDKDMRRLLLIVLSDRENNMGTVTDVVVCFLSDLACKVYNILLDIIASSVKEKTATIASSSLKVIEMDNTGLSKLRYLGGYVVHVLLSKYKSYAHANMMSENKDVMLCVEKAMTKVKLLQSTIIIPYEKIVETTTKIETLDITEQRQYASRGLLHITDEFFDFMIRLEQARVNHLSLNKFKTMGEDFLFEIKKEIMGDIELAIQHQFFKLFNDESNSATAAPKQKLIAEMFEDAVNLYIRVGAKEVLKDFKRCFMMEKSMAHRQMVLVRTKKKEKRKAKISLKEFSEDRSEDKCDTHAKLKASIIQFGDSYLWTVFKVSELKILCAASGIEIPGKTRRKMEIAKLLLAKVKDKGGFEFPFFLDRLMVSSNSVSEEITHVHGEQQRPLRLTIRAVRI